MKKNLLLYLVSFVVYFGLLTLYQRFFNLYYISLWIGGLIGMLLPDTDRIIYAFLLNSESTFSKELRFYFQNKKVLAGISAIISNEERRGYLFHSALFQIAFLVLTIFLITSSGNPFGWGLAFGFLIHLLVNEFTDYQKTKNIDAWFFDFPLVLSSWQQRWYLIFASASLIILGLAM